MSVNGCGSNHVLTQNLGIGAEAAGTFREGCSLDTTEKKERGLRAVAWPGISFRERVGVSMGMEEATHRNTGEGERQGEDRSVSRHRE